jgi:hypothetical protein
MTKYEQMELAFFKVLKNCSSDGYFIKPHLMERDYGVETRYVRETLIRWADDGLISLDVYSSNGFRPYTDWQNIDDFFEQGNRVGHVRVKLLAAGDEHLERLGEIVHKKIGF